MARAGRRPGVLQYSKSSGSSLINGLFKPKWTFVAMSTHSMHNFLLIDGKQLFHVCHLYFVLARQHKIGQKLQISTKY